MFLRECPRCGTSGFESLRTHGFCVECNYSPDLQGKQPEPIIPRWAIKFIEASKTELMNFLPCELALAREGA